MKNFIIRLNGNEISEKHARECVEQAAKFGIDVNYFDAVHGSEYTIHLEKLKILPRYKFKKQRIGVYGCFLSHYYLWKQCVEDNIPYTILEHDGYFINLMPNNVLDNFTDVLKLDNLDPYSKNYNEEIDSASLNKINYTNYTNPKPKNSFDNTRDMYEFLEKNRINNIFILNHTYCFSLSLLGCKYSLFC